MFLNCSTDITPSLALTVSISDVSNLPNSSIVIFCSTVTSGSWVACDTLNGFRGKAGFLPALLGGFAAAASEDDDVESSDSKLDDGTLFFFKFFFFLGVASVSDSDSDDESDESESK